MIPEARIHEMWKEELQAAEEKYSLIKDCVQFELMGATRQIGVCYNTSPEIATVKVSVAITSEENMRDTMRHELAHAIVWLMFGVSGHPPVWRKICIQLGGDGKRCHDGSDIVKTEPRYTIRCECGHEYKYQKAAKAVKSVQANERRYKCNRCKSKELEVIQFKPPVTGIPVANAYSYEIKKRK